MDGCPQLLALDDTKWWSPVIKLTPGWHHIRLELTSSRFALAKETSGVVVNPPLALPGESCLLQIIPGISFDVWRGSNP